MNVKVGAVVMATGWNPYDATRMDNLGFGKVQNVVTNMMMERLAAPNGPTAGKIVRPSDGKAPQSVAFIQCAGSRDPEHLPYCSSFCCMASLKQAVYVREQNPNATAMILYKDIRTPGQTELFYKQVQSDADAAIAEELARQFSADRDATSKSDRAGRRRALFGFGKPNKPPPAPACSRRATS